MAVNDPTYPATGVVDALGTIVAHYDLQDGSGLTAADIFEDDASVGKFYDASFTAISTISDHVLVKIDMTTRDPNVTPRVDGYAVRVLN